MENIKPPEPPESPEPPELPGMPGLSTPIGPTGMSGPFGFAIPEGLMKAIMKKIDPTLGRKKKVLGFMSKDEVLLWNKFQAADKEADTAVAKMNTYKDHFWSTIRINRGMEGKGGMGIDDTTQQVYMYIDEDNLEKET